MDQWVDDKIESLTPLWEPNTERALKSLQQRQSSKSPRWIRFGMASTILATTAIVLVMLPWGKVWMPKVTPPVGNGPVAAVVAPQQQQQQTKTEEVKPPAEIEKPQGKVVGNKVLTDLPHNEDDLLKYLNQLAAARSIVGQPTPQNSEPKVIKTVTPSYTEEAKQAKITGTVELTITVKTDGTAQFEKYVKTLGYGLDEKAREAAEQMLFEPAKKDGVAVAQAANINFNFSLR
jgi:TonB family protein